MTATVDPAVKHGSRAVRFVLDGQVVEVSGLPATTTVLEYLRDVAGRTGTKEGCAEGDCGACTVVLGELTRDGSGVEYRAVNSCIRFLPTMDGKELITVESLQGANGELHPVQRAMVDHHASQCGFCTPGFVMSLFALYQHGAAATREQVVDTLSGNLCRCTGYRPIIDAGCRMHEYEQPVRWSRDDAQSVERVRTLRGIQRGAAHSLCTADFSAPRSIDELAAALESAPDSLILSGGTDVGLWVTKHLRELPPMVYVGEVRELRRIERSAQALWIGASVPLSEAWPALVEAHPALAEQARRFASPPIRNSATLCGNLANGSPIGDAIPALMALGAELELRKGAHTRRLALDRFYLGYQKKELAAGEFIAGVSVPVSQPGTLLASYKLSKRIEQDISAVCATFAVRIDDGKVVHARLAYGGMAAVAARALNAEAALTGAAWSHETIESAVRALAQDFEPLTDMRASAQYRMYAAGSLLRRFYLQHSQPETPLRTAGVEPHR